MWGLLRTWTGGCGRKTGSKGPKGLWPKQADVCSCVRDVGWGGHSIESSLGDPRGGVQEVTRVPYGSPHV